MVYRVSHIFMYSGSSLSISPIEDMANCDIDIGNSGGK